MKKVLVTGALLLLSSLGAIAAHAQSANEWYPTQDPGLTVRNVWYDTRPDWGSLSRIGMTSSTGTVYYYYFSATNSVQVQLSNTIYASLLSAVVSGQPVFVYVTGSDQYNTAGWDFVSIQVGTD